MRFIQQKMHLIYSKLGGSRRHKQVIKVPSKGFVQFLNVPFTIFITNKRIESHQKGI